MESSVGEGGVDISGIAASKHWPLQPFLLPSEGSIRDRSADFGLKDGLHTGQGWGIKGVIEDSNANDKGNKAEDKPFGWREIENGSIRRGILVFTLENRRTENVRFWPIVGILVVSEFDGHSQNVFLRVWVANNHELKVKRRKEKKTNLNSDPRHRYQQRANRYDGRDGEVGKEVSVVGRDEARRDEKLRTENKEGA